MRLKYFNTCRTDIQRPTTTTNLWLQSDNMDSFKAAYNVRRAKRQKRDYRK